MAVSCGRIQGVELLVVTVETSPGSGVFAVDERLSVSEVTLGSDAVMSTARIHVRLDAEFDAAAARGRYQADRRVVVRTQEADAARQAVLFEGYPPTQEAGWRGGPGDAEETYGFLATHVYERLSREREGWIYGRRMRSGEIVDGLVGDPVTWGGRSVLVEGLPCVFNLDGAKNCAPTPLQVTGADGVARAIHLFTYDDDSNGIAWSYLNALRYLLWFYVPRGGPMFVDALLSATEAYVPVGVGTAGGDGSALLTSLVGACETLNLEATNLVEALSLLADSAGVHVTAETAAAGAGVRSQFRAWAAGDAAGKRLHLVRGGVHADGTPRFDPSTLSADDVKRVNDVARAMIRWQDGRIVNAPLVIGEVKAYEMTVPLVPGWEPAVLLDNVAPPDRAAAKDAALLPDQVAKLGAGAESASWFQKYHRAGSQFVQHRFVGRRWVLNEDGRFDAATYNRNAPFDAYQPFDFSTVTSPGITRRGAWARRSRALRDTITRTELGATFGVHVEISFDGGATWFQPTGPVQVLTGPTAILFDADNPTQITPPGVDPAEQNLWYALIDQTFRVRVTAVMEGDERLIGSSGPVDPASPTLRTTSRIVYDPRTYQYVTRQGTTDVLATVNPSATDLERIDSERANAAAIGIARRESDRRILATPAVPWLDRTFSIGDAIEQVRGRGISFVTRTEGRSRGPSVVGKRYRFGGGRWETELVLER